VDRLGPLLTAPSPRTAELHHQDVTFELLKGIRLVIDALELEAWSGFSQKTALPRLALTPSNGHETNKQDRRSQRGTAMPNLTEPVRIHGIEFTSLGLVNLLPAGDDLLDQRIQVRPKVLLLRVGSQPGHRFANADPERFGAPELRDEPFDL
jgi:hypothetical protein